MRIALGVKYKGSRYHGWQRQEALNTVQEQVEDALSGVAGRKEKIIIRCAGRTDAGVHATGQVVHFDTEVKREMRAWVLGTNSNLPQDIVITWAREVSKDFHARFSASARHYRYLVFNGPNRPGVFPEHLTWNYNALDIDMMSKASEVLLGKHDFTAFRAVGCQSKTPVKTIQKIQIEKRGDIICYDFSADGFLHHMVRNIIGVLFLVGAGKKPPSWVSEVLASRDRRVGGPTAPAYGLYFTGVDYPEHFNLPEAQQVPLILI